MTKDDSSRRSWSNCPATSSASRCRFEGGLEPRGRGKATLPANWDPKEMTPFMERADVLVGGEFTGPRSALLVAARLHNPKSSIESKPTLIADLSQSPIVHVHLRALFAATGELALCSSVDHGDVSLFICQPDCITSAFLNVQSFLFSDRLGDS